MADAKICDRCGSVYTEFTHDARNTPLFYTLDQHTTMDMRRGITHSQRKVDLCRYCEADLARWFDSKKATEEDPNDVDNQSV